METKRVFLAALLSMAVLIVWQIFFPTTPAEKPPADGVPGVASSTAAEPGQEPQVEPGGDAPADGPRQAALSTDQAAGSALDEAGSVEVSEAAERTLVLESPEIRAEFTNRGAQLVSFVLKNHPEADGAPVDLVRKRDVGPYLFALTGSDGKAGDDGLNAVFFEAERRSDDAIAFNYSGPAGQAKKSYALTDSGLLEVTVDLPGRSDWGLWMGPGVRNPSQQEQDARFSGRSAVYLLGGDNERVDSLRIKEPRLVEGTGLSWIGLQDTYFLNAWLATEPVGRARLQPVVLDTDADGVTTGMRYLDAENGVNGDEKELAREQTLTLFPAGDRLSGVVFLGAKEYDRLASFGLERTVNLGIFWFIARPLLWGLRWIHDNMVGNYGWAIVLMTVLIRLLLFPLTHKGFLSMQKMQRLNPKMQAIRQQYRPKLKDKRGRPNAEMQRKMNEEIMALYKTEGVNPAGGCLPMLLQIPVFFAFYNLLSSAFELRLAPWLGWIQDLSAMDPYYILPVAMGVAMLAQQKLMPAMGDPMQRRMMMFMPFFITFVCLKLPSGLALYWTTSNVLGIVQQAFYSRIREDPPGGEAAAKAGKATRKVRT